MDRDDAWHERVLSWWKQNRRECRVPVTVLPEIAYLTGTRLGAAAEAAFARALAEGEFLAEPLEPEDIHRAADLTETYTDMPLGFTDASIVAMAERLEARTLLTTDRRHFSAIRPAHARGLDLAP